MPAEHPTNADLFSEVTALKRQIAWLLRLFGQVDAGGQALSISQFCARNNISRSFFYKLKKRRKEAVADKPATPEESARLRDEKQRVQWVDVCDQMPAHAIGIDQFHHPRLPDRLLVHLIRTEKERIPIDIPTQGRMRNLQIRKNLIVEFIFAEQ